jgi:acetyl-CoA C-acetyltransferase
MISQACATGAAVIATAGLAVETGDEGIQLAVNADRVSNGPHIVFPQPKGPGGTVVAEDWVMDNFNRDAWFGHSMLQSAEYVAADAGASRQELDDVTFLRYEQYRRSLEDDRAFQRRYMVPVELPGKRGETLRVDSDHGIHDTTLEGLQRLEPVLADGVTTYGSQTHPADGAAGAIVTTEDRARALGDGEGIVRLLAYGLARVETARMPKAPVPAAERALRDAGLTFADVDAVTTHNPFTINDIWFARQTGIAVEDVNLYGSSLVFGHPHAATGNRLIAELIETLRLRGGGIGLFTGCAAGDSGAALVLRVDG